MCNYKLFPCFGKVELCGHNCDSMARLIACSHKLFESKVKPVSEPDDASCVRAIGENLKTEHMREYKDPYLGGYKYVHDIAGPEDVVKEEQKPERGKITMFEDEWWADLDDRESEYQGEKEE